MGSRKNAIVSTPLVVVLMLAGLAMTGYGFVALSAAGAGGSAWRWTHQYLLIFLVAASLAGLVGARFGAVVGGLTVVLGLAVVLGAALPLVAVALLALSAFALGHLILRGARVAATDSLLVGIVVIGSVLGLLVHFPVNNAGTWGLLFALPLVFGWRHVRDLLPSLAKHGSEGRHAFLLNCAISGAVVLLMLVALMPEIGHDALVTHLFVPAHVAHHQSWHFDARIYAWAVMPMFVDWLYTAGYLFAGETGARLVNLGGILLMAALVRRLGLWAGASRIGATWAALLLLVTPLTFLETSSLFVESLWSAMLLGGTLALLRLLSTPACARTEILLVGILLGGTLAAKALTFTVLPVLALLALFGVRRWFSRELASVTGLALVVMLAIGAVPYVTAFVLTGNPVFPFFNAHFKSPLYPPENFRPPEIFERGVAWDTLYRMTFESGRYLEASVGAAGFQWLMLVVPALVIFAWARQGRALLLALVGFGWLWLAFGQTAYLRYVFPSFGLACAVVAVLVTMAAESGRWALRAVLGSAVAVIILNLLHFHAGTYYGKIDPRVILDARARQAYLDAVVPPRASVELINALNHAHSPVAFFAPPLTAGLHADALYASWYNPRFQAAINAAGSVEAMGRLLARENVEYVVLDGALKVSDLHAKVSAASVEVARIGPVSVRRLLDGHRFAEERVSAPDLSAGWHLSAGAVALPGGGVRVTVEAPASVVVPVLQGAKYRYAADARCAEGPAQGRLQVNWLRSDGQLARADIDLFDCTSEGSTYSMDVVAPAEAVQALVYASAHGSTPVIFTRVSFRN